MTYKCMSRMYVYGCLPRSHYQHNVPNSIFGLFFLVFLIYFSADNVKNLEHLDSALPDALTTLFLSWSGFLLTALWSCYKYKPHKHWNKEYGEAPKPQIDLWSPSRLRNVLCSFQWPRPGLQLLQISSSWAAVPELLFSILSKGQARSQALLQVSSNPQATSCSPTVCAGHRASTRLSAQHREWEPRADPAGERRNNSPFIYFLCQPHTSRRCASSHHLPIRQIHSLSSLKDLNISFPGRSP